MEFLIKVNEGLLNDRHAVTQRAGRGLIAKESGSKLLRDAGPALQPSNLNPQSSLPEAGRAWNCWARGKASAEHPGSKIPTLTMTS